MACVASLTITALGFLDWCLCMSRKREPDFLHRTEDDLQEVSCKSIKR